MSLPEPLDYPVPEHTAAVAHASFPKSNTIMRMRDAFGSLSSNQEFAHLYHTKGASADSPAHLALILIFQFVEGLSDAQAANSVANRIDWKYSLALPLTAPAIDPALLSDFRDLLIAGNVEWLFFSTLIDTFSDQGLLRKHGRQRTDATYVLATIRKFGRLE